MNFNHHPNPAIDFEIEVAEIEADVENYILGLPVEYGLNDRIDRALMFRVGEDPSAVRAKARLCLVARKYKMVEFQELGQTSRGHRIYRKPNHVGGYQYWSDEVGGGIMVWDTALVEPETLIACILHEVGK